MSAQAAPLADDPVASTRFADSYLLIANSALTAALGMLFWVVAARRFDAAEVAAAGSTLALVTLLADISLLELPGAATRYLAAYPRHRATLIKRAYAVVVATTTVAGLAFVALPADGWLGAIDRGEFAWFAAAWVLIVALPGLHDGILVGIGRTAAVPAKNLLFGAGKLALLVVFASTGWSDGILGAWMLTGVAVGVPTTVLITRWSTTGVADAQTDSVDWSEVRRFAPLHYLAGLLMMVWVVAPPILVTSWSEDAVSAAFFVAWTIGLISMTAVDAFMRPLTVAQSSRDGTARDATRSYITAAWKRALPVVAVLIVVTPLVLSVFGSDYRQEGTIVLRWLFLGVAVQIPVAAIVADARGRGDHRLLLGIGAIIATGILVAPVLAHVIGNRRDVGVWFAAAVVASHGIVAVVGLAGLRRSAR
ncbi:MAG: hypothetical protein AAFP84_06250 [Actinomycetota bacterium]